MAWMHHQEINTFYLHELIEAQSYLLQALVFPSVKWAGHLQAQQLSKQHVREDAPMDAVPTACQALPQGPPHQIPNLASLELRRAVAHSHFHVGV